MRIAIMNAFPNKAATAELEFIARFHLACKNLGMESATVVTSDDITAFEPDLVVTTHEFSRKLTKVPTIGLLWSPISFFDNDPYRVRSILSLDGFLCGNESIREYLLDYTSGLGICKPVSTELFLPTNSHQSFAPIPIQPTLCYVGVHWDGDRHDRLFAELAERGLIRFYGPKESWAQYTSQYGGELPFDGFALPETLKLHGIVLCLHRAEHRQENTPSMRLFEALSCGCIVICDEIEFAQTHLSEIAYFIDINGNPQEIASSIEGILQDVSAHPEKASERGRKGKAWFDANWSLETKIKVAIIPLYKRILKEGKFLSSGTCDDSCGISHRLHPVVEIIIRVGDRALPFLTRAFKSIVDASSHDVPLGVIVVDYKNREDIQQFCSACSGPVKVRYLISEDNGMRSTALWMGLSNVEAPFVAHLDDDDTIFPNHYRQMFHCLQENPSANVAYSGVIKVEDEDGSYFDAPNFHGASNGQIFENRSLEFNERFDLPRLARLDNFIQSNAWLARAAFVRMTMGEDPGLEVTEDVYLYLLLASKGPFVFTGSPTAVWHWRSKTQENSMLKIDRTVWEQAGRRVKRRLFHISFNTSLTYDQIQNASERGGGHLELDVQTKAVLGYGRHLTGGVELRKFLVMEGFDQAEAEGCWATQKQSSIEMRPSDEVRRKGGIVQLRVMLSIGDRGRNELILRGPDQIESHLDAQEWAHKVIALPFNPMGTDRLKISIHVADLLLPEIGKEEQRTLGVLIGSLIILRPPDDFPQEVASEES